MRQFVLWKGEPGIQVGTADVLTGGQAPGTEENLLVFTYGISLDAIVEVVPFAKLGLAVEIVVGHVHAAAVCCLAIDDYYLAVVAGDDMIDPRELDRIKLIDLYACLPYLLKSFRAYGLVVAAIAEGVVEQAYLNALPNLDGKAVEESVGYGVVAEIEVFHVNGLSGLVNSLKKVAKLILAAAEEYYTIVGGEDGSFLLYSGAQRLGGAGCRLLAIKYGVLSTEDYEKEEGAHMGNYITVLNESTTPRRCFRSSATSTQ